MAQVRYCLLMAVLAICIVIADPAVAEVRFGKNVRIGGHDISNQTFNAQRRGAYYIYNGKPARPGCSWRSNGDGSRTKVRHLQRKARDNCAMALAR